MYWQPESESMDRKELEQLQLERLESTLNRVYMNVPFYRKKFDEVKFNPDDLRSLDDLSRLPFTTKNDLRENYPYGLFAVPLREVVRIHASSGTTGMSTVVGYSKNDIKTWSTWSRGSWRPAASPRMMSFRSHSITAFSPAPSAFTTAPSGSARPSSPFRAATRGDRSSSCRTSRPRRS